MRGNRTMGSALADANLITIGQLDQANERLLELMGGDPEPRQCTLIGVLVNDLKVQTEEDILLHMADAGIGLVCLAECEIPEEVKKALDPAACWATWTIPFDREGDYHLIATAHYYSPAVRSYWEKQCKGPVLWYGTTIEEIADYLEKLVSDRALAEPPPVPAPAPTPSAANAPR